MRQILWRKTTWESKSRDIQMMKNAYDINWVNSVILEQSLKSCGIIMDIGHSSWIGAIYDWSLTDIIVVLVYVFLETGGTRNKEKQHFNQTQITYSLNHTSWLK